MTSIFHLILTALLVVNVLAILTAGLLANKRHRAQKKYWREHDQRNGT